MAEPQVDRPHVPGYGIPESNEGALAWAWARERLERALVYWLATTGPEGAPHLIPIWGAWVDDRWYVEGGPTRWQRNLRADARLAISVESGDDVVIVEGVARELVAPVSPLSEAILDGYAKYRDTKGYEASAGNWTEGGLWELRPARAFAWSTYPDDATRFRFDTD